MPKKKTTADETPGVNVRPARATKRYEDGVAVRTPDAPAHNAGANDGQSAGSQKEKN
jgi:hypothetical protein